MFKQRVIFLMLKTVKGNNIVDDKAYLGVDADYTDANIKKVLKQTIALHAHQSSVFRVVNQIYMKLLALSKLIPWDLLMLYIIWLHLIQLLLFLFHIVLYNCGQILAKTVYESAC